MIRLSLAYFYTLGDALAPLPGLKAGSVVRDVWAQLYRAQTELLTLLSTPWLAPAVKAATAHGLALHSAIETITNRTDFDAEVGFAQASAVTGALTNFDMVVRSELYIADAYFVTRKAAYDTGVLVSNAEQQFPAALGLKVPEAIVDVREAGKCLAFELSTASGFHILRATESVVREYWTAVSGGKPHPRVKTIGTYAKRMREESCGSAKAISTLEQIASLHRNPLIHPEETLAPDEAVSLFGICQSAVSAMLKQIPDRPPVTALSSPAS
jgi:hypothetical protein